MQLITDEDPPRFVQIWPSEATGEWVVREGVLGRAGRLRETGLDPASSPLDELTAPYLERAYAEADVDRYDYVVIQFPMRNSAYDRRLIERASEWLDQYLDERGLGYVDGYDRGKRESGGRIVVNIFARAKDGELGSVAAMAALRKGAADATRATIAHRGVDVDDWTIRYERSSGKLPGGFSL
ncbi:hypothetical protein [Leucobacter sp. wl10]|uniref:hypothetical protein n=1 Tax=Leucobacter sp. wl10 TaxID=2304677 RepID=UPI000E5A20EB|nr:hypothetical protein [Leucobacter sp. wl10]RGE18989.1 hypothetical protein D1J51_13570 [Leucobacter sp. wl10]